MQRPDVQVNSKENNSSINFGGRSTKKYMSEALNRFMEELTAMEELDEFVIKKEADEIIENDQSRTTTFQREELTDSPNMFSTEVVVKEEPIVDNGYEEVPIFDHIEQDILECTNNFFTNILYKEEPEKFITKSDARECLSDVNGFRSHIKLITEVSIKQEEEEIDQQYINCLEDANNEYLKILLPRLKCYMCEHCSAFFKQKRDLVNHIYHEHYLLFRKTDSVRNSLHYCNICDERISYKKWHAHKTVVHSTQPHVCAVCDKVFKHERYLRRHLLYVHGNVISAARRKSKDEVMCTLCCKHFSNKHALKTHNRNCHSEKVTCKICNSTLKSKSYLYTHMRRVHYDDGKMHPCELCRKQFRSPRYLKIHKKNAHKKNNIPPNIH